MLKFEFRNEESFEKNPYLYPPYSSLAALQGFSTQLSSPYPAQSLLESSSEYYCSSTLMSSYDCELLLNAQILRFLGSLVDFSSLSEFCIFESKEDLGTFLGRSGDSISLGKSNTDIEKVRF